MIVQVSVCVERGGKAEEELRRPGLEKVKKALAILDLRLIFRLRAT
jgi:hypothetical protein